jgi:hypothetical protein
MNKISVAVAAALLFAVGAWAQNASSASQSTSTTKSTTETTTSSPASPTTQNSSAAQSSDAGSHTADSAGQTTINGCVSGSAGTYMLTEEKTGRTYTLEGDDAQLAKQVGHEVSVSGAAVNPNENRSSTSSSATNENGSSASPDTRAHHVRVSSVKEVADYCATNNPTPK